MFACEYCPHLVLFQYWISFSMSIACAVWIAGNNFAFHLRVVNAYCTHIYWTARRAINHSLKTIKPQSSVNHKGYFHVFGYFLLPTFMTGSLCRNASLLRLLQFDTFLRLLQKRYFVIKWLRYLCDSLSIWIISWMAKHFWDSIRNLKGQTAEGHTRLLGLCCQQNVPLVHFHFF